MSAVETKESLTARLLRQRNELEAAICHTWCEALTYVYGFERGARANEIAGRYVKRFDERGLHPSSIAWGAIQACESLVPELGHGDVATTPTALREAARQDAWADHVEQMTGVAA